MKRKLEQLKQLLIESDELWEKIHNLHDEIRNYANEPDLVDGWLNTIDKTTFVDWAYEALNKRKNREKLQTKIEKLERELSELKQK